MNLFSKIFSRENSIEIENALLDHKAFSNNMSSENKQKLNRSWNLVLQKLYTQHAQYLSELSAKQRWNFAFALLNDLNTNLPFDLLKDVIPNLPAIHTHSLDTDIIAIIFDDIEAAKDDYGFTISELGAFSEMLAKHAELSIGQSFDAINHVLEIGLSNYSQSINEFDVFLTRFDIAAAKTDRHF